MPFMNPIFWNFYFKILVEPDYEGNDDQFAKYCQTPQNNRFQEVFCCWSSVRHFGALTVKFAPNPIVAKNMANFLKHCHRPFIHCFPLVYLCEFAKYCQTPRKHRFQQFAVLNIKVEPNLILAQNMANLHNTVTGVLFTVLCCSICAYYYVNNNLEFLLWNFYLTKLRLIKKTTLENIVTPYNYLADPR